MKQAVEDFGDHGWLAQNAANAFGVKEQYDAIMERMSRTNPALCKFSEGWEVKTITRLNVYVANPGNFLGVFQQAMSG